MLVEKTLIQTLACQLSSTLMQLLFSFDQDMRVEKTLIQTLACQLSSTLMQLLFLFDQDMLVEKTLMQNLACQLSSTLMQRKSHKIDIPPQVACERLQGTSQNSQYYNPPQTSYPARD